MKKIIYYLCGFLLLVGGLISCTKDSIDFKPDPGKNYTGSLLVTVVDEAGAELPGATVTYQGAQYTSDKYGLVRINSVAVNSKHNVLNLTKPGYFNATKVFAVRNGSRLQLNCVLEKKQYYIFRRAATGGFLSTSDSLRLDFPANAFKYEGNGQPYTGDVSIAIRYFNPEAAKFATIMPGNLSALTTANELTLLKSYGMIQVELETSSGEKLNIMDGKKVRIKADIPAGLRQSAPATIPLWHFDEASGYWKEEGTATRSGNSYSGEVSHFSTWNFDGNVPTVNLTGRILDQNGNPMPNAEVSFKATDGSGIGYGNTQADGSFSGPVAQGKQLQMSVTFTGFDCPYIHTTLFGPYSADTDIGDITVTFQNGQGFTITADLKDCNGTAVSDGRLLIALNGFQYNAYSVYPDNNGHITYSVPLCTNYTGAEVKALDLNSGKESSVIPVQAPGINNLGDITVCGAEFENLTLNIPGLNYNNVKLVDSLTLYNHNGEKSISAQNYFQTEYLTFNGLYFDNNTTAYATGIFTAANMQIGYADNAGRHYLVAAQNGMVNVTQGGSAGSKIRATFSGEFLDHNNVLQQFTGSFYLTGR